MAGKKSITTNQAPPAIGPYSQAIQSNGWLFVSGQIAINPTTNELIGGNINQQTQQVLENIKAIVRSAGSSLADIVKTTVYLKDMNEFQAMNDVYGQYFSQDPPARATIEVTRLPKNVKIEIDAIATIS